MKLLIAFFAVTMMAGCVVVNGEWLDFSDQMRRGSGSGSENVMKAVPISHKGPARYSFEWPPLNRPTSYQPPPPPQSQESEEKSAQDFFSDLERGMMEDALSSTATTRKSKPEYIDDAELVKLNEEMNKHIEQLMKKSQEMPPALNELFFGGNSSASSGIDKEVECVVKCEPTMQGNPKFEEYGCLELEESVDCVAKCRPGIFADFVYGVVKTVHYKSCGAGQLGDRSFDLKKLGNELTYKALTCANLVLSDLKAVVGITKHAMSCYLELLDAHNTKETCYAVKYCFIDETINKVKAFCRDDDMAEMLKFSSIYSITKTTRNGNIIRNCPSIYTMD